MKLYAKIKSEILDKILTGDKIYEYRQFESITLTDENERSCTFEIGNIRTLKPDMEIAIRKDYPDMFNDELKIRMIRLMDLIDKVD